jgi:hypothetical protein
MTAAERLTALAGSGAAGALLLAIGAGATAGAALVNYSGLPSATAAVHLLTDVVQTSTQNGGQVYPFTHQVPKRRKTDQLAVLITLL